MKRLLIFLCSIGLVFGLACGASANLITDTLNFGNATIGSQSWQHGHGLDSTATINSAVLTLTLDDDEADIRAFDYEYGFASVEGTAWNIGEVDPGTYTLALSATQLADGFLNVDLSASYDFYLASSTLTIDYTPGSGDTGGGDVGGGGDTGGGDTGGGDNPNTMANPVPAPILLLGTGLVGLAGFRRRKK